MKKKIFFYLIITIISFISCNITDPPVDKAELLLKLEDVSCTEAWITLTINNLQLPAEINLTVTDEGGDFKSQISNLNTQDSLLYVDSLLPNKVYKIQVSSILQPVTSNELSVTTMDTTSHNFTWQTLTFGDIGSSTLYDVAIINENNIWAVGDIKIADTSENGYTVYNAVHWNGNEWNLKRVPYNYQGTNFFSTIRSIFAFEAFDIWFGIGSLIYWNGTDYKSISTETFFPSLINKIWGTSSSDLYIVGNIGNIAHFNGSQWRRIESGTNVNINDVWGVVNQNNEKKIFCAVSFIFQLGDHKILTIDNNNKVDSIQWNTGRRIQSVWSGNGKIVYTSGGGVFSNKSGDWKEEVSVPLYYTNKIRGTGLNDIIIGGDFGLLAHYNGSGWKIFYEFQQLPSASFYSVAIEENIIVNVGFTGGRSLVVMGRRN